MNTKKWPVLLVVSVISLCGCVPSPPGTAVPHSLVTPTVPTSEALITHQDRTNRFELKYSEHDYYPDEYLLSGEAFALLLDVDRIFAGKNLEEVRINISVNPTCRSIEGYSPLTSEIEDVEINGADFTKYSARDAGTNSNTFEHITYQTHYAESCYELNISIREYVLAVFPELSEYSKDLLNAKLDPLIETFRLLDG